MKKIFIGDTSSHTTQRKTIILLSILCIGLRVISSGESFNSIHLIYIGLRKNLREISPIHGRDFSIVNRIPNTTADESILFSLGSWVYLISFWIWKLVCMCLCFICWFGMLNMSYISNMDQYDHFTLFYCLATPSLCISKLLGRT